MVDAYSAMPHVKAARVQDRTLVWAAKPILLWSSTSVSVEWVTTETQFPPIVFRATSLALLATEVQTQVVNYVAKEVSSHMVDVLPPTQRINCSLRQVTSCNLTRKLPAKFMMFQQSAIWDAENTLTTFNLRRSVFANPVSRSIL